MADPKKEKAETAIRHVLIFLVLYIAYMATLQPLLASLFMPAISHKGKFWYESNVYRVFDNSGVFQNAVGSLPFYDDSQTVGFSYYNHCLRDNPFWGEFEDLFVLELELGELYEDAKNYIEQNGKDCNVLTDYHFYWFQDYISNDEDGCFYVALCNETRSIRCVLLTMRENAYSEACNVCPFISRNYWIDWSAESE